MDSVLRPPPPRPQPLVGRRVRAGRQAAAGGDALEDDGRAQVLRVARPLLGTSVGSGSPVRAVEKVDEAWLQPRVVHEALADRDACVSTVKSQALSRWVGPGGGGGERSKLHMRTEIFQRIFRCEDPSIEVGVELPWQR